MIELDRLTKKQRLVYEFIRDKIRNRGYGPTGAKSAKTLALARPTA